MVNYCMTYFVAPYPVRGQMPPQPVPPPGVRGMAPTMPGRPQIPGRKISLYGVKWERV